MTTRKPKLNLLYVTDSSMPWLQLAVVAAEPSPSQQQQHARRWQSLRSAVQSLPPPAPNLRKH